jgi:ectoine hydroxylase-related dioxygenase (phytanoyl-CoA dioxygenase family)
MEEAGKQPPLKGAAFASRREKLSKQRHYNRQAAEKQEMEAGNLLFFEFRLYGGLDFCYNAENVRKAGTVYANEKKKQSGAADGGV